MARSGLALMASKHACVCLSDRGITAGDMLLQVPVQSKRAVIFGLLALLPPLLQPPGSAASLLKSLKSQRPSTLTFFNKTNHAVKIYW